MDRQKSFLNIYIVTLIGMYATLLFLQILMTMSTKYIFLLGILMCGETLFYLGILLKLFYQTHELLCTYSLFFQRRTEKKAIPHFCSSTVNVNKNSFPPLLSIRSSYCKCISILSLLTFLSSSFLMLTHERHLPLS